jgi:hypothetical protein
MCGVLWGVQACKEAGVPKLIHVSAMLADELSPSDWLRRKAQGEAVVSLSSRPLPPFPTPDSSRRYGERRAVESEQRPP